MEFLVRKATHFLTRHGAIDAQDEDIYEYGLYTLFCDIIDFSVTLVLAILLKRVVQSVLYYIAFIGLRRLCGGYHATTRIRCFIISMVTYVISIGLIFLSQPMPWLCLIFVPVSVLIIFLFAPVGHENNPLSPGEQQRMRRNGRLYCVGLSVMTLLCFGLTFAALPGWAPLSIAYGMLFFAASLSVAKVQKTIKAKKENA